MQLPIPTGANPLQATRALTVIGHRPTSFVRNNYMNMRILHGQHPKRPVSKHTRLSGRLIDD